MKLNDQLKKMALVVVSILILVLAYFLVVTPTQEEIAVLESQNAGLRTEKARLEELQAQVPMYEASIAEFAREINEELAVYPKALPQEKAIHFVHETEDLIPIQLQSFSIGGYEQATVAEGAGGIEASEEGEEGSPAPAVTTTAIGDLLTATSSSLSFNYQVGYPQLKQFLNYILTYEERMVINNISLTYSEDTMLLSGNFTMMAYAINGPGRPPVVITGHPEIELGTANVFLSSFSFYDIWDSGAYISPDFFLMISSTGPAWTMGRSRDVSEDSYLVLAENDGQDIEITFTGSAGDYEVKYKLGDEEYSGSAVRFEKDDSLNVDIYSFANVGRRPNVLASVSIYNQTDLPVNVTIYDDDMENPRVKFANTSGIVRIRNQNQ